jgi:hypothetical protein
MNGQRKKALAGALCVLLAGNGLAWAGVSAKEAEQLKTTLTPLGGERAGNKEGTIPAWDGGYTKPFPGWKSGDRRPDPFAGEKPLYSITATNMAQYADKLTDGVKFMLKKYANTYRIDVYPTHRTAAAPQWVYENTFKNATRAKLVDGPTGLMPSGAFGGIPFPIPQKGEEVAWNAVLRYQPSSFKYQSDNILMTAEGKRVVLANTFGDIQIPYYFQDGSPEKFDGDFWKIRLINRGPPIRAGEAITSVKQLNDDKSQTWVYLTGQRRTRKLPNACCDTPSPATGGIAGFDDFNVWDSQRLGQFKWKLLGKKEMYIPYNCNKVWLPTKDADVATPQHLNPDHVRWELHRVWVVEATLAPGQRHQVHRSVYYFDEDTWFGVLGDRWDASGRLWKSLYTLPLVASDLPGVISYSGGGFYDLVAGSYYIGSSTAVHEQYKVVSRFPDRVFTPDAMAGESVR